MRGRLVLSILLAASLWAALPVPAATGSAEDLFQEGNAEFRGGDTRAAERKYREALEIEPGHIGALLQLARVVSWHDRLDESIAIYEEALALDPGNLQGRLGLAKVVSWTGDQERATGIYREILGEHPGHHEATLGLAQSLAFADRTSEAEGIYLDLLREDPQDILARNGLARTLSWEGRLEEALGLYQQSIEQEPGNAEALAGRARVYYWQGRAPQAWAAFSAAESVSPGHREVLELRKTLEDSFASNLRVRAGVLVDSDDNVIDTQRATFTFTPSIGTTVAAIYNRFDATQPCRMISASPPCDLPGAQGHRDELATRLETVKGQLTWRWKPDLVLSGSAGLDRIDRERAGGTSIGTASAGVDWRMNDRWSFSGALSRETFAATALTLDRGVGLVAATATAAWNPIPRLGARMSLQRMDLTDGNDRLLMAGLLRWSVPARRPRIALTWNARYLDYGEPGTVDSGGFTPGPGQENGYFSPDSFWANIGGIEISDRIGERIGLSASGSLGIQRVRVFAGGDTSSDTVRGYYLRASYDFGRRVSVEAWYGRTNLALQGPTGYTSAEAGVALRWNTGWPAPGIPRSSGTGGGDLQR